MKKLFPIIGDLDSLTSRETIVRSAYGMIEAADGRLQFIQIRPWPKLISGVEALWLGGWTHRRIQRDRVQVWYNQPLGQRNYLTLSYGLSAMGTSLATIRAAHVALDRVAEIKRTDAILCHVTNRRVTDRVMKVFGYERHLPHRRGRHYIRRFYGQYPNACASELAKDSTHSVAVPEAVQSACD